MNYTISWQEPNTNATISYYYLTIKREDTVLLSTSTTDTSVVLPEEMPDLVSCVSCGRCKVDFVVEVSQHVNGSGRTHWIENRIPEPVDVSIINNRIEVLLVSHCTMPGWLQRDH